MPLSFLRGERDGREGIKVPKSILKFHCPLPLPISSAWLFSSEREKEGREIREENMPQNFSITFKNSRRQAQTGRAQPSACSGTSAVPSLSLAVPASRFAVGMLFSRVPASASPLLSAQPLSSPEIPFFHSWLFLLSRKHKGCSSSRDLGLPPATAPAVKLKKETARTRTFARDYTCWKESGLYPPSAASLISCLQLPEVRLSSGLNTGKRVPENYFKKLPDFPRRKKTSVTALSRMHSHFSALHLVIKGIASRDLFHQVSSWPWTVTWFFIWLARVISRGLIIILLLRIILFFPAYCSFI